MAKIQSGGTVDLLVLSQAEAKVGDFKWSALDETTFNGEHLGLWKHCNGQSCVGTAYATMTGNTTVPNALVDGSFIRQAKSGRSIASKETDSIQGHKHIQAFGNNAGTGPRYGDATGLPSISQYRDFDIGAGYTNYTIAPYTSEPKSLDGDTVRTDLETRPKNIALNLYVKVGY